MLRLRRLSQYLVFATVFAGSNALGHEVGQRFGGYSSGDGESRSMAKLDGRADLWPMMSGDLQTYISINAAFERVRFENPADSKYMSTNFPEGRRLDRNVGFDNAWTYEKRTELSFGGAVSGDGVTKTTTKRVSLGQWTAGDQLRFGVFGATSETKRPTDSFLDYDSETIDLKGRVISQTVGTAIKAILNPSTIVTAEVSSVRSTERPNLHAWAAGIRQFVSPCDCAFHGDVSRAVNLGKLDTNMANGELTGLQWTAAYLQSFGSRTQARVAYRFAREDEYTRAYGDHLVFGADSYTAALTHEIPNARMQGAERPLLLDVAATRYIHNKGGAATTLEAGAGVKF